MSSTPQPTDKPKMTGKDIAFIIAGAVVAATITFGLLGIGGAIGGGIIGLGAALGSIPYSQRMAAWKKSQE
ncbi:hypothetical protein [Parasphingopyxis sp.]|uniref:hypothetical protein n=1 Tax=Parasphingopyxis sp. TaxID=1920299 RepID=UPI00263116C1|nr:hypothetical protein [Parasphingopyxis sp.]